jgi:hypothetical protein
MDLFVEFKTADTPDPFCDPDDTEDPKAFTLRSPRTLPYFFVADWPLMLPVLDYTTESKDMETLRHYRMSLDVLTLFRSSKELVSAIADAWRVSHVL